MRSKNRFFGVFVLLAAFAFTLSSCDGLFSEVDAAPKGVVATLLSNGSIHVTWDLVSGADGYIIAYRTNLDSSSTRRDAGNSTITAFTHSYYSYISTDVTTLYYYVKAYKGSYYSSDRKETEYSSPVSVTIK